MKVPLSEVSVETKALVFRQLASKFALPRAFIETLTLSEFIDYAGDRMVYELRGFLLEDQLESDQQDLHFVREVPTTHRTRITDRVPRTTWDAWKVHHPRLRRALRLRAPRWRVGGSAETVPRTSMVEVEIKERVTIERSLGYPDHTLALDPKRMGYPIYIERLVHPLWRRP